MRRTKIVCTLGPASNTKEKIRALVDAGMSCARLNFSHGDHESHRKMAALVREAAREAVMRDLQAQGLETLGSRTAIVPAVCGADNDAFLAARGCHERGIFVQKDAPEYCREYEKIMQQAMKG